MKFNITRNVENNKFETMVRFEEYGGSDIDAEQEKEMLDNYPITISLKDIDFTGYFKVVDNEVEASEELEGDEVTISLLQRKLRVDDTFVAKFEANATEILKEEFGDELVNGILVCQAKSLLFEDKIVEAIRTELDKTKGTNNEFENKSPITIII